MGPPAHPGPARPQVVAGCKILLAAIVPKGGPCPDWVEIEDNRLVEETGQSRPTIQRHFKQLETAGWIMQVRTGAIARSISSSTWPARGTPHPRCMHVSRMRSATRTSLRVMHAPPARQQDL